MSKEKEFFKIQGCSKDRISILLKELNKFRCYMTGYIQGSQIEDPVGFDSLRQIENLLKNSLGEQ